MTLRIDCSYLTTVQHGHHVNNNVAGTCTSSNLCLTDKSLAAICNSIQSLSDQALSAAAGDTLVTLSARGIQGILSI